MAGRVIVYRGAKLGLSRAVNMDRDFCNAPKKKQTIQRWIRLNGGVSLFLKAATLDTRKTLAIFSCRNKFLSRALYWA